MKKGDLQYNPSAANLDFSDIPRVGSRDTPGLLFPGNMIMMPPCEKDLHPNLSAS